MKPGPSVAIMLVLGLMLGVLFQLVSGPLAGALAHVASDLHPGARVRWVFVILDGAFLVIGVGAGALLALRSQTVGWRTFWIGAAAPIIFSLIRWLLTLSDALSTGGTQ